MNGVCAPHLGAKREFGFHSQLSTAAECSVAVPSSQVKFIIHHKVCALAGVTHQACVRAVARYQAYSLAVARHFQKYMYQAHTSAAITCP